MTTRFHHLAIYLIATILSPLADGDFLSLRDNLNKQVESSRSQGVVMDVSGLDVMDSFTCRTLNDISRTMKLRGTETAIVGIHPEIKESMERFGLKFHDADVAVDLNEGLAVLDRKIASKHYAGNQLPSRSQDADKL